MKSEQIVFTVFAKS